MATTLKHHQPAEDLNQRTTAKRLSSNPMISVPHLSISQFGVIKTVVCNILSDTKMYY